MPDRRAFLAAAGAGLAAARTPAPAGLSAQRSAGLTVLFQGDSITDCRRDRAVIAPNRADALGTGYPLLVAATMLRTHADAGLQFFNRGISGNKVPDLQARWDADAVAPRPDVLSILVGVNDIWHRLAGTYTGTVQDYATGFAALLEQTKSALPGVRLVILEPFVLRTGQVNDRWFPEFDERRAAAAQVARQAGARFIALQEMFDRQARRTGPGYWAADGVHPTPAGHSAIAQAWMQAVHL